ncbi:hypothetical protein GW17_00053168 [Ensete ventricosum]|nr:hypothetical protein GW17_00053168 [Ensete ventricosum]
MDSIPLYRQGTMGNQVTTGAGSHPQPTRKGRSPVGAVSRKRAAGCGRGAVRKTAYEQKPRPQGLPLAGAAVSRGQCP